MITLDKLEKLPFSKEHYILLGGYAFIILCLGILLALSLTETFPFDIYKRDYAPPGISTGQNVSPYTPI